MFNNLSLLTYEIPYIWIYNMYWYIKSPQLDLKWLYPLMVHCWVDRQLCLPVRIIFYETNTIWAWYVRISLERVVLILAMAITVCEVWCAVTLAEGSSSDFAKSKLA